MQKNQKEPTFFLTKYELSRIIGIRVAQLNMSAPILIDGSQIPPTCKSNFYFIAALELKNGLLDFLVERPMPGTRAYDISLKEMGCCENLDSVISMFEK